MPCPRPGADAKKGGARSLRGSEPQERRPKLKEEGLDSRRKARASRKEAREERRERAEREVGGTA